MTWWLEPSAATSLSSLSLLLNPSFSRLHRLGFIPVPCPKRVRWESDSAVSIGRQHAILVPRVASGERGLAQLPSFGPPHFALRPTSNPSSHNYSSFVRLLQCTHRYGGSSIRGRHPQGSACISAVGSVSCTTKQRERLKTLLTSATS